MQTSSSSRTPNLRNQVERRHALAHLDSTSDGIRPRSRRAGVDDPLAVRSLIFGELQIRELVVIDKSLPGHHTLMKTLLANAGPHNLQAVLLDEDVDGIDQVSELLAHHDDLDALHLFSCGEFGAIRLGATWFDENVVTDCAAAIAGWGNALSRNGRLILAGCGLANHPLGCQLADRLASLTNRVVTSCDAAPEQSSVTCPTQEYSADPELVRCANHLDTSLGTVLSSRPSIQLSDVSTNELPRDVVLSIAFSNTGQTPGHGPLIDLIVPKGEVASADLASQTLASGKHPTSIFHHAKLHGRSLSNWILEIPDDGSGRGEVEHPFWVDDSGKPCVVPGCAGDKLVVMEIPRSCIRPGQKDIRVDVTFRGQSFMPADIQVRAGFRFGNQDPHATRETAESNVSWITGFHRRTIVLPKAESRANESTAFTVKQSNLRIDPPHSNPSSTPPHIVAQPTASISPRKRGNPPDSSERIIAASAPSRRGALANTTASGAFKLVQHEIVVDVPPGHHQNFQVRHPLPLGTLGWMEQSSIDVPSGIVTTLPSFKEVMHRARWCRDRQHIVLDFESLTNTETNPHSGHTIRLQLQLAVSEPSSQPVKKKVSVVPALRAPKFVIRPGKRGPTHHGCSNQNASDASSADSVPAPSGPAPSIHQACFTIQAGLIEWTDPPTKRVDCVRTLPEVRSVQHVSPVFDNEGVQNDETHGRLTRMQFEHGHAAVGRLQNEIFVDRSLNPIHPRVANQNSAIDRVSNDRSSSTRIRRPEKHTHRRSVASDNQANRHAA